MSEYCKVILNYKFDTVYKGDEVLITWEGYTLSDKVNISLINIKEWRVYMSIVKGLPTELGSYNWIVPDLPDYDDNNWQIYIEEPSKLCCNYGRKFKVLNKD